MNSVWKYLTQWVHPPILPHIYTLERSLKLDIKFKPVASRHIRNTCVAWQVKDSCMEFRGCWQEVLQKEHRGVRNVLGSFFSTNIRGNEFAKFFPLSLSWPPFFPQSLRALDSSISSPTPLTDCLNIYTGGSVCPSLSSNSWGLPALPRIWFMKSSGPNEFSRAVGHHVRSFTASISQGSNVGFCHQLAPRAPLRAFTSSCSPSEATHLCYLSLLPSPCPLSSPFF